MKTLDVQYSAGVWSGPDAHKLKFGKMTSGYLTFTLSKPANKFLNKLGRKRKKSASI